MRRPSSAAGVVLAMAVALIARAEPPQVAYAPKTTLEYAARVCGAPARTMGMPMANWSVERGYEAVGFAVAPGMEGRGTAWYAFDTGQRKVTVLEERLAGGRMLLAATFIRGRRDHDSVFALSGGHLLWNDRPVAGVEPGWTVCRLSPRRIDRIATTGDVALERALVGLARSDDGRRYQLMAVNAESIAALGIEGGAALERFLVIESTLYLPGADNAILRRPLSEPSAPAPVQGQDAAVLAWLLSPDTHLIEPESYHRGASSFAWSAATGDLTRLQRAEGTHVRRRGEVAPGLLKGAAPAAVGAWTGGEWWTRRVGAMGGEQAAVAGGLKDGFIVFGRPDKGDGGRVHLFCYLPARQAVADLGPLADHDGRALTRVDRVQVLYSGDIAVLAGNDAESVLQIYRNPVADTLCAQAQVATAARGAQERQLRARVIGSLYDFAPHADRTFGSLGNASDGRVYFGVMPHNPVMGSPVFRFDPTTDELICMGEFDALAGVKAAGRIPNMMHAPPVEVAGRLYFTGQDPFYGRRGFPGMTPENVTYPGSPLLAYRLADGAWEPMGIPLPADQPGLAEVFGGASVFHVTADAANRILYLRPGYSKGDWWRLRLGEDGRPLGPPVKMPFDPQPHSLHVTAEGTLLYPVQVRDAEGGSRCEIHRFDAATGTNAVVADFDLRELLGDHAAGRRVSNEAQWFHGGLPQPDGTLLILLRRTPAVVRFNPKTNAVSLVGAWPKRGIGYFAAGRATAWFFLRDTHRMDTVSALAMDLTTGAVQDLGKVVDDRGRWFREVTTGWFAANGDLCLSGTVFSAPGDHYARRYRRAASPPRDSALWVIDDAEALAAGRPD